jgi:hypothetical protein
MMRWKGKGRPRHKPGEMNKLEAKYAEVLEYMRIEGDLLWWAFEAWKFRLADRTFFTPDFIVMTKDRELEAHEVKAHWEDDARVKIKVAAEMHPILFKALKWSKHEGWSEEVF